MNQNNLIELSNSNSIINDLNKITYKSVDIINSNEVEEKKLNSLIKFFIKKFKNQLFKVIAILCFILSVLSYILSNEGCYLTQYECVNQLKEGHLNRLFVWLILSCLFYCTFLIFCIHKKISRKFLLLTVVYIYLFNKYYKADWDDHGFYNRMFFVLIVIVLFIVFEFIYLLISIYKKKKYKLFTFFLTFPFILAFLINYDFKNPKCKG